MIVDRNFVIEKITQHTAEFVEVKNPGYVYPTAEYYPLAPKIHQLDALNTALMDMDGTTTTTEVLCIFSLEQMVRRMSGLYKMDQWEGIDHNADLPYIIGNSTTRHVEYLISKYGNLINSEIVSRSFIEAAAWTLRHGRDAQRQAEVIQNLRKAGQHEVINQMIQKDLSADEISSLAGKIKANDFTSWVSLGIDIYYEIYHRILGLLGEGKSKQVRRLVFGNENSGGELISPMPGIIVLLPLLKGWLGREASVMAPLLFDDYLKSTGNRITDEKKETLSQRLVSLGIHFEKNPVKLGLVTSSIFYEANIVINEVLGVVAHAIAESQLSPERKARIIEACSDYHLWYDAFVTASDSSEIRLKPHRDLYSIALHKAGVMPSEFMKVIGFEDSQSGTVAIRAAGIGCCIAVPFAQTHGHDFSAATHIALGGIPEVLLDHQLFIKNVS